MAATMLIAMLIMSLAAWMYAIGVSFLRVRTIIAEREQGADWLAAGVTP
jgi:heme exporter protein C